MCCSRVKKVLAKMWAQLQITFLFTIIGSHLSLMAENVLNAFDTKFFLDTFQSFSINKKHFNNNQLFALDVPKRNSFSKNQQICIKNSNYAYYSMNDCRWKIGMKHETDIFSLKMILQLYLTFS